MNEEIKKAIAAMVKGNMYLVIAPTTRGDAGKYHGVYKGQEDGGKYLRLTGPLNEKETWAVNVGDVQSITDEGPYTRWVEGKSDYWGSSSSPGAKY
jgi:hypothetical protein